MIAMLFFSSHSPCIFQANLNLDLLVLTLIYLIKGFKDYQNSGGGVGKKFII